METGITIGQALQIALRHHAAGNLLQAESLYQQVLSRQADQPDALHLLGVIEQQRGRHESAVDLIRRAIAGQPKFVDAYYNLGNSLISLGRPAEAIIAFQQAMALRPDWPEVLVNLGTALKAVGSLDEAIGAFNRAVHLRPEMPEVHSNLAAALTDRGDFTAAIAACNVAISLRSNYAEAFNNLGAALKELGKPIEAIAALDQAIKLKPDYAEAHTNLGAALGDAGEPDAAIAACRRAIAVRPNFADAHYTMSLQLLLQGNFDQGWKEYEWRWHRPRQSAVMWKVNQPRWDGSDFSGRTLFVHDEQGFGDTIHFIRYLPLLAARGAKLIVGCPPTLRRILQISFANIVDHWLEWGEAVPAFDAHCPLMSLPLLLGSTLENIPRIVPYLHADPGDVQRWREHVDSVQSDRAAGAHSLNDPGVPLRGDRYARPSSNPASCRRDMKVGLVWAGNPQQRRDASRSISLADLAPLANVAGVRFFSLQKGVAGSAAADSPAGLNLVDFTADLHDFADTAALIANLDLVISVDTAVAHLAGAMGKPVWVLLHPVADWRWLLHRSDSPWYPTMRLFRQTMPGDWSSVLAAMMNDEIMSDGRYHAMPGVLFRHTRN